MNSTQIRDLSIAGGIAAGVAFLAYTALDDILCTRRNLAAAAEKAEAANIPEEDGWESEPLPGRWGDLHQVVTGYHGQPAYRYVRPATERDLELCDEAKKIAAGDGIFAIGRNGAEVLPDSPEWNSALADDGEPLTYYRVS